jgi:hypothetical protein
MKIAKRGLQTHGFAHRGSPRSGAIGFEMTRANADLKPANCGQAVAMRTSMPNVISEDGLSIQAASRSEPLDNPEGSRYGLELVIPMSIRRVETR